MFSVFNLSTLTIGTISDVFENIFCCIEEQISRMKYLALSPIAIVILRCFICHN